MNKTKRKSKFKTALVAVLVVALTLGAFGFVLSAFNRNSSKLDYSLGALDEEGRYEKSNKSIYTKDAFEFDTVKITRDFESDVTYQLFYYDELDKFVSSSEIIDESAEFTAPEGARYARLVIYPTFDAELAEDNQKLNIFNVSKCAKQLTVEITVNEVDESPEEV